MAPVQPRISLIYTTNNEKNLAPKVCSKKYFQNHISGFLADFAGFVHIGNIRGKFHQETMI